MKNALNKLIRKETFEPLLIGLACFLLLTFLIFPALTSPNTLMNILGGLGGVILILFLYYYLFGNMIKEDEEVCEAGETELDYIPKDELVSKTKTKKQVSPKSVKVKGDVGSDTPKKRTTKPKTK